jgi:hypothetical protein
MDRNLFLPLKWKELKWVFAHYGGSQMTSLKVLFQAIFHPFQVHLLLVW